MMQLTIIFVCSIVLFSCASKRAPFSEPFQNTFGYSPKFEVVIETDIWWDKRVDSVSCIPEWNAPTCADCIGDTLVCILNVDSCTLFLDRYKESMPFLAGLLFNSREDTTAFVESMNAFTIQSSPYTRRIVEYGKVWSISIVPGFAWGFMNADTSTIEMADEFVRSMKYEISFSE